MTKFTNVIVRRPAKSMVEGITSAPELGKPDYELASRTRAPTAATARRTRSSRPCASSSTTST